LVVDNQTGTCDISVLINLRLKQLRQNKLAEKKHNTRHQRTLTSRFFQTAHE